MKPRTALMLVVSCLVLTVMLVGTEDKAGIVGSASALVGSGDTTPPPVAPASETEEVPAPVEPVNGAGTWGDDDYEVEEFVDPYSDADGSSAFGQEYEPPSNFTGPPPAASQPSVASPSAIPAAPVSREAATRSMGEDFRRIRN